jgi:predicted transcriptional regulator
VGGLQMKINQYKVNEEGLNRFFGPLEAKVMDIIWSFKRITIKHVRESLNKEDTLSFNAIMTVMNRLSEKGHLVKVSSGKGRNKLTYFEPIQTKIQFIDEQTKLVTKGLINEFGDLVMNHMIEALEDTDPELLKKLEHKLQHLRQRNP